MQLSYSHQFIFCILFFRNPYSLIFTGVTHIVEDIAKARRRVIGDVTQTLISAAIDKY